MNTEHEDLAQAEYQPLKMPRFRHKLVGFVLLLSLVVVVHELGHLFAAKYFGVAVEAFSIGFGPELFGFAAFDIYWKVSMLPLGGYVQFPSQDTPFVVTLADISLAANLSILLAGVVMNLLFAVVVVAILRAVYKNNLRRFAYFPDMRGWLIVPFWRNAGVSLWLGWPYFFWFSAATSIELFILNILPIYPLDGGQVFGIFVLPYLMLMQMNLGVEPTPNMWLILAAFFGIFYMARWVRFALRPILRYMRYF